MTLDDLPTNARDLAVASLAWCDARWDKDLRLLANRAGTGEAVGDVRNSIWYAAGLLLRRQGMDDEDAAATLRAVLDHQFDEPGMPYHGTFARNTAEAHPPYSDSIVWQDYDPNWRQFIGLGFAVVVEEFEQRLPADLVARIDRGLELAVVGEPADRCSPRYSNIALMKAALNVYVGNRLNRPDMIAYGEAFGREVHALFIENKAFGEYNSPTYYGVNLYALGFWRRYLGESDLFGLGAEMEAELWRDIGGLYHADLRNLCGPYTRSYGMDMAQYTAIVSQHIWMAFGREKAPHPPDDRVDWEFAYGPCLAILGADAPEDVADAFTRFDGPRPFKKRVTKEPRREITAWLGDGYMLGAESSEIVTGVLSQFRPVTAHWQAPDGSIGWIWYVHYGPTDAQADEGRLRIKAPVDDGYASGDLHSRDFRFRIHCAGLDADALDPSLWQLPGMRVGVEIDASAYKLDREEGDLVACYTCEEPEATFELVFEPM